jgi:hypothetical protein
LTSSRNRIIVKVLSPIVGLLLATLLITIAARGVEWDQLRETLVGIESIPAVLALISLLSVYVAYSLRWAFIIPSERSLKITDVFPAVMIGYLVNTVTPLRLGDIARSTVMSRSHRIPVGRLMGSIFAEHIFDALILAFIVAIFALFIPVPPAIKTAAVIGSGLGIIAGVFIMTLTPERFGNLEFLSRPLGRIGTKAFGVAREFNLGFNSLRQGRRVIGGTMLTLLVWLLMFTYAILLADALSLDLPWYAPIFALALAGLGSSFPGTPASIGIFQIAIVTGLSVWTDDATSALAYGIAVHAVQLVLNVLIGGIIVIRAGYGITLGKSAHQ